MNDIYITTSFHPLEEKKYALTVYVGNYSSIEEAKKATEEIGPVILDAINKVLK